jgi:hypothetical protein
MLDFVKAFHDAFRGATWLFFLAVAVGFACVGLLLAWMVHNSIEKREAEEQQSSVLSRQLTVEWHMVYPAAIPPEGRSESADMVELVFTGIEWATFKAEELQEFAQDCIRLHPRLPK